MITVLCSSMTIADGFLPMAGKMWLLSAPLNPEID
ncbi:hypothetical protein OKW09_002178 [Pseudomonas rhodesiae]|jgi:hypothetical protein|nr:hypothetical protein [Pseudomonas rhodesiae]MDF9769893.1 hypothetical protein [Pseudomonas rhodesiae]